MTVPFIGGALIDHSDKRSTTPYGRIVLIKRELDLIVIAPFPRKDKSGFQRNYIRTAKRERLSLIEQSINEGRISVVKFETPSHWLLTVEQLKNRDAHHVDPSHRRNLRKWVRRRAVAYGRIRPFVHGRSISEIILDPDRPSWPTKRAAELGLASASQVQRDLNAYILGLGERNSLLPWYSNCGGPNKFKYSKTGAGRPQEFTAKQAPKQQSLNANKAVRIKLALGWRKHKKRGVTDETAFHRTLEEFFSESTQWDGPHSFKGTLKPEAHRLTLGQFRRWGKTGVAALMHTDRPRQSTPASQAYLRRMSSFAAKNVTANGEGLVDSTSCDQSLVSAASRLTPLMSPWRTEVVGSSVGYIFGMHVGFESPSATTALMAILNAAESKVAFCAKYGVTITEDEWLPMVFRRYSMDNGEGKNKLTMSTIDEMQSGAAYGSAYDAINKYLVESDHRRFQAHVDHHMPGSTHGRLRGRGEPNRALLGQMTFDEYIPHLIRRVLYVNNEEIITLPRIEMRAVGANPTRRDVIKWMISEGYLTSTPTDLTALRVKCLPRIKGVIHGNGLRLFDPSYTGQRLIPELVYRSDWLLRSGILERAARRTQQVTVHINPSNLSELWVNIEGLKRLSLATEDPALLDVTLLDWLLISKDDRLSKFLGKVKKVEAAVDQVRAIKQDVKRANADRKVEIAALPKKPSKTELTQNKREHTAVERSAITGIPRQAKMKHSPIPQVDVVEFRPSQPTSTIVAQPNDFASVIAELRRKRAQS
ncbi:hypothetical protein EYS42_12880 [Aquabacterium lacunae]|uniref:Integrase catalytic domain-containing protein n=1 Tax=Aquabacterium lacunae TaxID=2528630 RepID=A0A4Q9H3L3_9BURK|nr:hypothetical protein [Aquabacterium lacunae]TBO29299.1 hypothetical protein EYS42_12880 [Aquabacterium lacunae]